MCFHQPTTLPTDIFGKFGNMFLGFEWALKYSLLLTLQVTCLYCEGQNKSKGCLHWLERSKKNVIITIYNRPSKYPSRIVFYPMSCGLLSFVDGYEGQVQDFQAFRARAWPKDERSGEFRYRGLLWLLFQGKEGTPRNLGKLAPWVTYQDLEWELPFESIEVCPSWYHFGKILEDFLSQEPRWCGWSYLGFHKAMKFRGAFDALDESALLVDQGVDGPASRKAKVCLVQFSLQRGWLWALDAVYVYYLISLALILKSEAGFILFWNCCFFG